MCQSKVCKNSGVSCVTLQCKTKIQHWKNLFKLVIYDDSYNIKSYQYTAWRHIFWGYEKPQDGLVKFQAAKT